MNADIYKHPITGEPCSRQAHFQVKNIMNGKCRYHKLRTIVGGNLCASCLEKYLAKTSTRRPSKEVWKNMDWSMTDNQIALTLNITTGAVKSQRAKAMGVKSKYLRRSRVWIQPHIGPAERAQARNKLVNALTKGVVQRKPCAVCEDPKSEGHHFDYTKPLEVIWLCKKHHGAVHRTQQAKVPA